MKKLIISAGLLAMSCVGAFGGGYQVSLHGHKQIGMGLSGTSLHFDASSAFYNPGALGMMPTRYSFSAGGSAIISNVLFQKEAPSTYRARTENPMGTPFYFYAGARVGDNLVAALAINTPYGNGLKWEDNWIGRFLIKDISMRAITIQPTLAYQVNDMISFGAGLVYVMGSVDMNRALPVDGPDGEGNVNINGSTNAFGYNAGLLIKPIEALSIGVSYRSRIDVAMDDANAVFSVPQSLSTNFPTGNTAAVSLPLPSNLDFGISYQASEKLLLAVALNYVGWKAYDTLSFDFAQNTSSLTDSKNPRNYSNKMITRIGMQYQPTEKFALRIGGYYDPSPVNVEYFSPETPSLDNVAFTAGLSFTPMKGLSIDLSTVYVMGGEKQVSYAPDQFNGTYKSRAFIPGIGLSYSF